MNTALLIAGLVSTASASPALDTSATRHVTRGTTVRAFHANAFVAVGGDLDIELAPVQASQKRAFLMSDAFEAPDAPMNAGSGWLFIRDAEGNGVTVLVDEQTTLWDIEEALEGSTTLQAEFAVAWDHEGAHLVGVFDQQGQAAFTDSTVAYRPAPSLTTDSAAMFTAQGDLAWPTRSFSNGNSGWSIDEGAVWGTMQGTGLQLDEADRADILAATLPEARGWNAFLSLSKPMRTPTGWTMPANDMAGAALDNARYDRGYAWLQRDNEVRYLDAATGTWQSHYGAMNDLDDALVDGLKRYNIVER
jgi:hypothetical protein